MFFRFWALTSSLRSLTRRKSCSVACPTSCGDTSRALRRSALWKLAPQWLGAEVR
jgi:hypothetical protein